MNIDKIYGLVLQGYELTRELLLSKGYSNNDIDKMVKTHLLRENDGVLYANDVDDIYAYYKRIVRYQEYDKQLKILDMVLELKPTHRGALFQKFFVELRIDNYYGALDAFEVEYKMDKKTIYRNDSKLQLLMLSKLVNVGEDLYKDIDNITFDDIKVLGHDNRYPDIEKQNQAREKIFNQEYEEALQIGYGGNNGNKITFQELVIKTLLNKIIHAYDNGRNYQECIIDGRYADALFSINRKDILSEYDELVKYLLEFLLYTPDEIYVDYNHEPGLWEAVQAGDFEYALALNKKYNNDKRINDDYSPVSILLREIIYMISTLDQYDENEYAELQSQEDIEEEQYTESNEEVQVEENVEVAEETEDSLELKVYYVSELLEQGISFEEALEQTGFNSHIKEYITLVYAREAFIKGNSKIGDKLLSMYNRSTEKDEDNNKLYKKIVDSKKFLGNRTSTFNKSLNMPKKVTRIK